MAIEPQTIKAVHGHGHVSVDQRITNLEAEQQDFAAKYLHFEARMRQELGSLKELLNTHGAKQMTDDAASEQLQELECQLQQEQAGIADAVMDLVVSDTVSSASEKALITELASAKAALESEQAGVVTAVVKMAMSKVISRSSEEDLKTKLTAVKAALEDEKGRAVSEAAALQALANNHQQQLEESQAFGIDAVDTSKRWAEYANDLRGALDNVKEQLATAEDKTKTSEGVLRRALSLLKESKKQAEVVAKERLEEAASAGQALAVANSGIALVSQEFNAFKQQAQKELQASVKMHEGCLTKIKASKFPQSQAEAFQVMQKELDAAKQAAEAAKAGEAAAAAAAVKAKEEAAASIHAMQSKHEQEIAAMRTQLEKAVASSDRAPPDTATSALEEDSLKGSLKGKDVATVCAQGVADSSYDEAQEAEDIRVAIAQSLESAGMTPGMTAGDSDAGPSTCCVHCESKSHQEEACPWILSQLAASDESQNGEEPQWQEVATAVKATPVKPQGTDAKKARKKKDAKRARKAGKAANAVTVHKDGNTTKEEDSRTPPTSRPQGRAAGHEAHTAKASEVQQAVRVPQSSRGLASVAPPGSLVWPKKVRNSTYGSGTSGQQPCNASAPTASPTGNGHPDRLQNQRSQPVIL